ncbi:unnamed protein product, partial [Mesorhabditis belari]|uniref:Uncharacterized protein n=1 Tax=Mesorhabditis belari TaxID=2138241 RepID=A0AAF3ET64_9BILA
MNPMYALKSARPLQKALAVDWQDGFSSKFSYVWLRDNGHRRPSLIHLDLNTKPEEVDCQNGVVHITWPPFLNSLYSSQFLRDHAKVKPIHSTTCPVTKNVLTVPWRVERRRGDDNSSMATTSWKDRHVEHGTIWPHMIRVPSIVTVDTDWAGARVNLVDAVQCLSEMSLRYPEEFGFLRKSFVEYESALFKAAHPVMNVEHNRIVSVCFNNSMRSPEITTESIDAYYTSLKIFNRICCEHLHTITLNPNELLVIDNSQTLVGAPPQNGRKLNLKIYD